MQPNTVAKDECSTYLYSNNHQQDKIEDDALDNKIMTLTL